MLPSPRFLEVGPLYLSRVRRPLNQIRQPALTSNGEYLAERLDRVVFVGKLQQYVQRVPTESPTK